MKNTNFGILCLLVMDNRLFLVDGHALIFKMYYAFLRHPMINTKGVDTSILFGFTKYIFELIEKEKPTHLAIAFDPPGGTFRNKLYPEYKANRAETPQLVIDALEPLTEICGALHIPVLMLPGFEADDVIGSMATREGKKGFKVYMVTPDKDYGQLVSDNVFQYKPGKSGSESEILDKDAICSKYGIASTSQVIDMLTICGDTADNVPGVKGVGEVGAGKLISKYGSVSGIYEHISELTPRQREAFENAREHIGLSHELVTIKTDIPIEVSSEDMLLNMQYEPAIAGLFEKYEFNSLRKYIEHIGLPEEKYESKEIQFRTISPEKMTAAAVKAGKCSIVTECAGDNFFAGIRKVTIGLSSGGKIYTSSGDAEDFRQILENPAIEKAGYDLKFQCNLLKETGIDISGRLADIELMHYVINPEKSHKPDILAKSYLGIDMSQENEIQMKQGSLFDDDIDLPEENSKEHEAAILSELAGAVRNDLAKSRMTNLYESIEEPLIWVLSEMERTGVKVDLSQLREFAQKLNKELEERQSIIREMTGEPDLNISSPKQVGHVLFEKMALDPKAKAKTGTRYSYSTDEETLTAIADKHPVINEILEYRAVKKLLSTYIEPFHSFVSPGTGKIHTTFNQALTATGRLSSSKPNLQNIPIRTDRGKEIRKAFVPSRPDGIIMSADYSQIELRIMAHLCGDRHLTDAFIHNLDVHSMTAAKIFGVNLDEVTPEQRRIAKTANFGIMYGISSFGLAQRLRIPRSQAKKIIDDYFANFPDISSYISKAVASAKELGYVKTLFGRRRYLPDITSGNATVRALAERNAINAPIQGTSADIIKKAMTAVEKRIREAGLQSRMVLQIHDELVFDALESEAEELKAIVVKEMENVIKLSVPLTVECNYGKNWLEAH